jgi:hypothetical protein
MIDRYWKIADVLSKDSANCEMVESCGVGQLGRGHVGSGHTESGSRGRAGGSVGHAPLAQSVERLDGLR